MAPVMRPLVGRGSTGPSIGMQIIGDLPLIDPAWRQARLEIVERTQRLLGKAEIPVVLRHELPRSVAFPALRVVVYDLLTGIHPGRSEARLFRAGAAPWQRQLGSALLCDALLIRMAIHGSRAHSAPRRAPAQSARPSGQCYPIGTISAGMHLTRRNLAGLERFDDDESL